MLTVALVHDRHAYGYYGCTYYCTHYGTYYGTNYGTHYMALTMALTTAGLLHRARRVHRWSAARLLLRARRHAPPARALLRRGQPHCAPTLALSLSLSLALALNLVATLALIRALSPALLLGLTA